MRTDVALIARDGIEDFGDAVSYVVAHNKLDEKRGHEDADYGIDEVEGIGTIDVEIVREQMLYEMHEPFE